LVDRATFEREAPDVRCEVQDRVAIISLTRPPVNAFRTVTWEQLDRLLVELADNDRLSALVIRAEGSRLFSAGADVKELPMPPSVDERRQLLARRTLSRVSQFPVPVICAVRGPALGGGCVLASACDVRLATRDARFALPEITVGRCGGARHLMRHLPPGVVRAAAFTGRPISAAEAWRLGYVNELFDTADALDAAALELANAIAANSPVAVRLSKQSLDLAEEMALLEGYAVEQQFTLRLSRTPDAAEAAAAFRDKRPPRWSDDRTRDDATELTNDRN
jgi:enoyl-CoA hydratase